MLADRAARASVRRGGKTEEVARGFFSFCPSLHRSAFIPYTATAMPKLPQKREPQPDVPTVPIALLVTLMVSFAFFGLLAVILPGAGMMALTMFVLGVFFWLQYVIWGKWLFGLAVRMEHKAEAAERQKEERMATNQHQSPNTDSP